MVQGRTGFSAIWALALAAGGGTLAVFASGGVPDRGLPLRGDDPTFSPALHPTGIYQGNASCMGSSCHDSATSKEQSGRMIGDEFTVWNGVDVGGKKKYDPHSKSMDSLGKKASTEICAKLNIADAKAADRCLSCHGTNAPSPQRGAKFDITDAVGCERCHGPAEKWLDPHDEAGWTDKQRAAGASALASTGLTDTSDLEIRARLCVSCHLRIDKDMVDAGHPALAFEFYSYNNYLFKTKYKQHWDEGKGDPMRSARLWAIGQVVGLAATTEQAKQGETPAVKAWMASYQACNPIVKQHLGGDTLPSVAKATITKEQCAAAAAALVTAAAGAKDGAENDPVRVALVNGVDALVSSASGKTYDTQDAEYKKAYDAATAKGATGDTWLAELGKMAAFAK